MIVENERGDKGIVGLFFFAFAVIMTVFAVMSYYHPAFVSDNGYIPYDVSVHKYFDGHTVTVYAYTVSSYYGPGGNYALSANSAVANGKTVTLTKTVRKNFLASETVYVFTAPYAVRKFAVDGRTFTSGVYHDGLGVVIYGLIASVSLLGFALAILSLRKDR